MANIAHHSLLHTALGCLLLASYTQGYYDDVSVSPTITLADWPLHPHLPASFLATVDKVVITSFISVRSEPAQPHHLLVTKNGGVFLYGKSAHLGFEKKKPPTQRELEEFRSHPLRDAVFGKQQDAPFLLILTEEGEIWSMGDNSMGQLGRKLEEKKVASRTPAVPSSQGKLGRVEKLTNIVEICAGAQHGLARDDQGRVFMWGYVLREEGVHDPRQIFPVDGSPDSKAVRITCGLKHSALLTQDNKIYSWGANDQGQLGTGNKIANLKPTLVLWQPEDDQIEQLTSGASHMAVLTSSGRAYLWGANNHGQLGLGRQTEWVKDSRGMETIGSTVGKTKPTELRGDRSFDMIMASGQMTVGCSTAGHLYVWGHFGGRNEILPAYIPVTCDRHRDLLRHGLTLDTGGMVAADTHTYGADYTQVRNMLALSEAELMNTLKVFRDQISAKYNSRLDEEIWKALVIGLVTLVVLVLTTLYLVSRLRRQLANSESLKNDLKNELLKNIERSKEELKTELLENAERSKEELKTELQDSVRQDLMEMKESNEHWKSDLQDGVIQRIMDCERKNEELSERLQRSEGDDFHSTCVNLRRSHEKFAEDTENSLNELTNKVRQAACHCLSQSRASEASTFIPPGQSLRYEDNKAECHSLCMEEGDRATGLQEEEDIYSGTGGDDSTIPKTMGVNASGHGMRALSHNDESAERGQYRGGYQKEVWEPTRDPGEEGDDINTASVGEDAAVAKTTGTGISDGPTTESNMETSTAVDTSFERREGGVGGAEDSDTHLKEPEENDRDMTTGQLGEDAAIPRPQDAGGDDPKPKLNRETSTEDTSIEICNTLDPENESFGESFASTPGENTTSAIDPHMRIDPQDQENGIPEGWEDMGSSAYTAAVSSIPDAQNAQKP